MEPGRRESGALVCTPEAGVLGDTGLVPPRGAGRGLGGGWEPGGPVFQGRAVQWVECRFQSQRLGSISQPYYLGLCLHFLPSLHL